MKKFLTLIFAVIIAVSLCACSPASSSSSSYSKSSSYDYDKGYGYTAPKAGQSFSDYVKEQDPDLYASLFG